MLQTASPGIGTRYSTPVWEPDPDLIVEGNFRTQSGLLAIETLLSRGRPFSALFVANDQMASGVRLGLYRRGIRVPDDIALIGFDDQPHSAYMIATDNHATAGRCQMGSIAAEAIKPTG